MSARIEPRTLKGFKDTMPGEALVRNRMFRTIEGVFESFGYAPIDTPALEYAEILKGKGGDESDKQMFEFDDAGGRKVALRFDLTVPLARFVAEHQNDLAFPFRRYHIGPVWRGERPQKGRYREFYQCDADLIGPTGPAADAEILVMFSRVYAALGIEGVEVHVNDRRILNGLLDGLSIADKAVPVLRALDKWDKVGADGVRKELAAAGVPADAVRVDPTIARGLDYYTGMVWEAVIPSVPGFGSVGSGGRYDDLAGLYTNTKLPGVGCSVGVTRLLALLAESGRLSTAAGSEGVIVTHPETGDASAAFALAAALRREGFAVETYPEPRKHAAQMKFADRKGLRFAVTIDPDGSIHGKDLRGKAVFTAPDAASAADELSRLRR